jgi:hypothetical protein
VCGYISISIFIVVIQTVGYGDLTIEKQSSRVFSVFYIIVSVVIVAGAIGNIGAVQVAIAAEKKRNAMLTKKLGRCSGCSKCWQRRRRGIIEMHVLSFVLS